MDNEFDTVQFWDEISSRWGSSYYRYRMASLDGFVAHSLKEHEDSGIVVADVARFESWLATLKTNIYEEED